ncbi:MAG TPA: hypothetical protein V6C58_06750 [Allocoleopsis sp.]
MKYKHFSNKKYQGPMLIIMAILMIVGAILFFIKENKSKAPKEEEKPKPKPEDFI